jgi:hypothetical protein
MDLLGLPVVVCQSLSPCLCLCSQMPARVHEYCLSSLTRSSVCRKRLYPLQPMMPERGVENHRLLAYSCFSTNCCVGRPMQSPNDASIIWSGIEMRLRRSGRHCLRHSSRHCPRHRVPAWYRSGRQSPQWDLTLLSLPFLRNILKEKPLCSASPFQKKFHISVYIISYHFEQDFKRAPCPH